jgi:alginate O-acetyltransferase complex protein AlgI
LSASVSEFWQRWHRSLYAWVRDYIYIPLGGNRGNRWKTYRNRFCAMLLMGIWHGANTTMLVFGAINGLSVVLDAARKEVRIPRMRIPGAKLFSVLFTFHAVCIPFVYFRSVDIQQGSHILQTIWTTLGQSKIPESLPVIGTVFALALLLHDSAEEFWPAADRTKKYWRVRPIYDNLLLYAVLLFGVFKASQFIYFQF